MSSKKSEIAPGVLMPMIGIGTYQIRDKVQHKDVIYRIVDAGLECGYRLIDTAAVYRNEEYIGEALQLFLPKYDLKRSDIFITSKLAPSHQGKSISRQMALQSLRNLKTDYIDLYLIHWPGAGKVQPSSSENQVLRRESWQELEKLYDEGKFRAIGVSNYLENHLSDLLSHCRVRPAVNQCEFHPFYKTQSLVKLCTDEQVHFQAYSSFGSPQGKQKLLDDTTIVDLAKKLNCSAAQVLLAWALHQGVSVLPRTKNLDHLRNNYKAIELHLSDDDLQKISEINSEDIKFCWNPATIS